MALQLVTGGAGFIGSHIVRALLARGARVRVLDNFFTGKKENLPASPNLEICFADVRDADAVMQSMQGVQNVFHQAAIVSPAGSLEDPMTCWQVNVQGTVHVLEAARCQKVQAVTLASSAAVYGEPQQLPLTEDAPLTPITPYATSKLMDEQLAELYTRAFGLHVTALRYFNVFGPRQSPDSQYAAAIPIFIRCMLNGEAPVIFGDGLQQRDFVNVADVVRANLLAVENSNAAGQVFNVCTGKDITLLDLLKILRQLIPNGMAHRFGPPRPGDIQRSIGSPRRAVRVLGFQPQVSLQQGLAQIVEWMSK